MLKRLPLVLALLVLCDTLPTSAVSTSIVISQVYGGGGNSGASFQHDYVELFNRGTTSVSLSGWSIQYASATGTGNFASNAVTLLSGSLAPGQYYLIRLASSGAIGAVVPAQDASGTVNMSGTAGKVALVNSTTGLACNGGSTPCSAAQLALIVDLIGYGSANFFEGSSAAPTLSNTSAAFRLMSGCTETDNNGSDFASGTPSPRNSSSPLNPCTPVTPTLNISDVSLAEGDSGTTTFSFTVSLTAPAGAGGVTFDIATADGTAQDDNPSTEDNDYVAKALTGQTISAGSRGPYTFDVMVNGDTNIEPDETFFVNVTSLTGATAGDTQGQGTIRNDDIALSLIHDVQGPGPATPVPGATVKVEAIVVGSFQGNDRLQGFFLQEEDADVDADPATSEGIFVFCNTCPVAVSPGDRVRVTGVASEFFNMTEITASTIASVVVLATGNPLPTASSIDLPVVGDVDAFYEALEGMRVTFVDSLTVSEYFELPRYGQLELFEGGRPHQFTETTAPNVAGYAAHLDDLARRRVVLDDDDNTQNVYLNAANGSQSIFHPQANGGFSIGTQGTDFFRGGDLVNGLTGVLHWSFAGQSGTDDWRIRPDAVQPATFTVANPRPATPPAVGGAIKAVSMNLLNYFTTIDTTSSSSSGPCGPSGTQDCRGADSVAELNRQRERASIVICGLDADVYALMELENTASATIVDLLGAVNARCGGATPYQFVNTGGTLGTDAIRVQVIYRTGVLSPVGSALVDLDPVHNRPPTAQTFDVVDAGNPAFGRRFTVVANHFKSKGCPGTGADADILDGQGCFNGTRTAQATRLLAWLSATVLPAAGDPDVLLLGDFNAYAKEDPVTTLVGGGFTDLASSLLGPSAYSYVFDAQLGHLDYAFASASLAADTAGVGIWHINADESTLLDYNDEIKDVGEATFEEKPDGSALVPPRVVFEAASPYRASDHDPVIVGLFRVADLTLTKTDAPDPIPAGNSLTYTITVTNNGPDAAASVDLEDALPAGTVFQSVDAPAGWSCTTPAVNAPGTVSCALASLGSGDTAVFTLTVLVNPSLTTGTTLSNSATVSSVTSEGNAGDESATASTSVLDALVPGLSLTKTTNTTSFAQAGDAITYTIVATNTGNVPLTNVAIVDPLLPALTCAPGQPATLASTGDSLTCTGTYLVTPSDLAAGQVTNTASASGQGLQSDVLPALLLGDDIALPEVVQVMVTAQGSVTVFGVAPGISGTRLALAACTVELQQDWEPRFTKLQFEVWNEDEIKFTGAYECADSWHETDFGTSIDAASQNFTLGVLGTYSARYRVQGVTSTQCQGSRATGLLGVQSMRLGAGGPSVGSVMAGAGKFTGSIRWDPAGVVPEGAIRP